MFEFRCGWFPRGMAYIRTPRGDRVTFTDGTATVDDPDLAAALREVPEVFRIVQVSGPEPDSSADPPRPPARRSGRSRTR
jgi:hypothetical protein